MIPLLLSALLAVPASALVAPGIDVVVAERGGVLRGKKVALITHPAGVTSALEPTADALFHLEGVTLVALMGPEHGIRGAAYAGETVTDRKDAKTGLPVYSLYGKTPKPTPEMLKGADVLVYDLQDIGSRSYTYIASMAMAMDAAADAGIPFVVLDRPDPVGGERIEGNVPPLSSTRTMVSYLPIPYEYGMTPGELARMINGEGWLPGGKHVKLEVVPMKGWERRMSFADTGLPWVPTSPHIPHADAAFFYAATGIVGELELLNEGVGYPVPFELLGAPWIDADKFAERMNALKLPGVHFRPLTYKPFYATHKDEMCNGVQIHLTDPRAAPLTAIQFHALEVLAALHPDHPVLAGAAQERQRAFDKVMGFSDVRARMTAGTPFTVIEKEWEKDDAEFRKRREKYLLYR